MFFEMPHCTKGVVGLRLCASRPPCICACTPAAHATGQDRPHGIDLEIEMSLLARLAIRFTNLPRSGYELQASAHVSKSTSRVQRVVFPCQRVWSSI